MTKLPSGLRVVVSELGETPADAIEHHVRVEEMLAPDPAELGPRDVLVEVRAASVGWVDVLMTSGQYQHVPSPPYTPGLEYSGVVLHKGPDAGDHIQVGDRVLSDGFSTGPRSLGDYQRWGGFATYAVAPDTALFRTYQTLARLRKGQ